MPYVKIGGTWLETDTPSVKIGGTWLEIDTGHCKVDGAWHEWDVPPAYDPVFSNNDWATVIQACQNNEVPDTWSVGDWMYMTINGSEEAICIIGKNHDSYSDGSGYAPLTFETSGCYSESKMNTTETNVGGWKECYMRNTTLPSVLSALPAEVQAAIREVNKLTSAGNKSTTIVTTSDKLFLLSEMEMYGVSTLSAPGEGVQYEYYSETGDVTKIISSCYWTRSPSKSETEQFCYVKSKNSYDAPEPGIDDVSATIGYYYPFAFCF